MTKYATAKKGFCLIKEFNIYGAIYKLRTATGYDSSAFSIKVHSSLVKCCSKAFLKRVFALASLMVNSGVLSHMTYGEMPGENQWNYDESTSINFGIGLMNPTLKAYSFISASFMDPSPTWCSGI